MRVFLSAYSGFTLAVPMDAVAAMVLPPKQETENIMQYEQESRSTFVSLPRLFNLPNETAHHGIVLREWNSKVNKVVLLTAEVKRDIEIPDAEFYPIPKALGALRFSQLFSGIQFSDNPVLLLNVKQLSEVIQKEQQAMIERKNRPVIEERFEPQVIVEEKKPPVIEEKSEPQVIAEEKKPPVTTVEKSEPQVIVEETKQPVIEEKSEPQVIAEEKKLPVIEEKSEPQVIAEEESDPLVIDEIIELQAIDEESEQQVTKEKSEPQVTAEKEKEPQIIIAEEKDLQITIIDEEKDQQITIEDSKQPVTEKESKPQTTEEEIDSLVIDEIVELSID